MKLLVTGVAGFIGSTLAQRLCQRGDEVIGIDNLNDYYDVALKKARLERLQAFPGFSFRKVDIADADELQALFRQSGFERVLNMAAQAGVRYSLENPSSYIQSNMVGFANLLECCRHFPVEHLVYASSSSVYGANRSLPYRGSDAVDHPISLYAASKKSNELMAHSYSHLYQLATTGLRFFTVYGPWGRPDMSPILFADAITEGRPIKVFNQGRHSRDFTYIDDIVDGVLLALDHVPDANPDWSAVEPAADSSNAPWRIYNIGRGEPVGLLRYIELLEQSLGKTTVKELVDAQPGDVEETFANIEPLQRDTGYSPSVSLEQGLDQFANWYLDYYAGRDR